jgi:Tol biopolymer transport system component
MSWEPGSKRLAFTQLMGDGSGVWIYDFRTGETEFISPISAYEQFNVSWGNNDWIAYMDNSRMSGGGSSQYVFPDLVRMRPDGTERTLFDGGSSDKRFQGQYPSWAPSGQSIALGGSVIAIDDDNYINRVGICDNPFDADPTMRSLNSEERIRSMVEALIPPADVDLFYSYYAEGVLGVAWSPDGEWVAYASAFGPDWLNQILCKSRVGGTGDIEVHALGAWSNNSVIDRPCWSPDGTKILYNRRRSVGGADDASQIEMITLDGSMPVINLSAAAGQDENTRDVGPAWFGV